MTNETKQCWCPGGAQGVQTCSADCSQFDPCVCPDGGAGGSAGSAGAAGSAGSAGDAATGYCGTPQQACPQGGTQQCNCLGGAIGTQFCNADCSAWSVCSCTSCGDGGLCSAVGYTQCQVCHETVGGQPRDVMCQKGIMVLASIPWDPVCWPDAGDAMANDCQALGQAGWMTVIIKSSDAPPTGQVLALYGKVHYYQPDAGADVPYEVWKFGLTGQTQIIATPIASQVGIELTFAPGFTTTGNTNYLTWTNRCPATGCAAGDTYEVCSGTTFVGAYDHGNFVTGTGSCGYHLNGNMTVDEIDCIN